MKSLQEQLLNKGLIDKDTARKAVKNKQKQSRAERKAAGKKAALAEATTTRGAMNERHAARDRELNRIKQQEADQKAIAAQIRQLIDSNRIDRGEGDVGFNFVYKKTVRKMEMSSTIQQQLALGRLNIVALVDGGHVRFELVPNAVASKIAERDPGLVIETERREAKSSFDGVGDSVGDSVDGDDPYAAFVVPDDLMW